MKKQIITIAYTILFLLYSQSLFAACQADINMGNNRIGNLKAPYDNTDAATRAYVDGLLSPIQLYWQGGDPTTNTISNAGAINFSTTTTANSFVVSEQAPLIRGMYNTCVYNTTDQVSLNCATNQAFFYNISGIQFKKNFTFQAEIKLTVETANIFFHLKAPKIPTAETDLANLQNGNFALKMRPAVLSPISLFCNYQTDGSTSYVTPSGALDIWTNPFKGDWTGNGLATLSLRSLLAIGSSGYHKIRIDYIEASPEDNAGTGAFGGNILYNLEYVNPYAIIVFWVDTHQVKAFRVPLAKTSAISDSKKWFYPQNLGNYIGIYNAGSSAIQIKNVVVDSGMIAN